MRLTAGAASLVVAIDVDGDRDVGHHGCADAAVELADGGFDVFVGPHVFALAEVGAGQLVEQPAVDVVADAEREQAGANVVGGFGILFDGGFVGFAVGGQAVGEEDDVVRAAAVGEQAERAVECAVDIGAAAGVEAVDEADGGGAGFVVEFLQLGAEGFDRAVVGDDVEHVAFAKIVEHELERALGLLDLLAAHAARAVDDEDDGLGDGRCVGRL